MFSYHNMNKGFTLIELLVGLAIIITTTTVILSIILSSFRISSKSTSLDTVRQNGNYAIGRMSKMIQFADSFGGVSNSGADGSYSTTCTDNAQYPYIKITHLESEKIFKCINNSIYINDDKLINSPKISTTSCSFKCIKVNSSALPVVTIKFQLSLDTNNVVEKMATIPFSTSVLMRNK